MAEEEKKKTTTKECPKCGDTRLVSLTSQNIKLCNECKTEIPWYLDNNQKGVYT
jgi:ribosomal protein L37AE/L43A